MSEILLKINDLNKKFGRLHAVNNLNLTLQKGSVFGLLGPNGSGKTTTLGMLLGVIKPTSGSFEWFGEKPSAQARKKIGAILERPIFYPYMSAYENLKLVCEIKEIPYSNILPCLKLVNLADRQHDKFKGFSLGMKQRLSIASAMLANPEVLILDEPTNGLDPSGINEIRELIIEIAASGKTIILASHLLDEVQKVCNDFIILSKGQLIYEGNVQVDLEGGAVIEIAADNNSLLEQTLKTLPQFEVVGKDGNLILVKSQESTSTAEINQLLSQNGIYVSHLAKKHKSLEKRFLEILQDHA